MTNYTPEQIAKFKEEADKRYNMPGLYKPYGDRQHFRVETTLSIVSIYNEIYCPVCDQQQPHVELIHNTGVNLDSRKIPKWDLHRLETFLKCLHHCDTEILPEVTIASGKFYEPVRDQWYKVSFREKPMGATPNKRGRTATHTYFFSHQTYKDEGCKKEDYGSGGGPAEDLMKDFPWDKHQQARDLYTVETLKEHICGELWRKNQHAMPKQIELF